MKIILIMLTALMFHQSFAAVLRVDSLRENSVKFFAKATLGNFTGETEQITGYIKWEGRDTLATGIVLFEVDLASIDTGIGLRNGHMRDKYLETDQYPSARYEGKLVEWSLKSDSVYAVKTKGTLTIHGVDQPLSIEATLAKRETDYQAYLDFKLDITDFKIKKPRFLISSMNEVVTLQLNFFLKSE